MYFAIHSMYIIQKKLNHYSYNMTTTNITPEVQEMSSSNPRKVMITKKRSVAGKSFRLIDFHVYDEKVVTNTSTSSDEESESNQKSGAMDQYYEHADDFYAAQQELARKNQAKIVPPKFTIQMYGINEKGETCSIFVNDYQPFFYVLVGDNWTEGHCQQFHKELVAKLGKSGGTSIVGVKLVEYNKLYGFTAGKQSKFVCISFHNTATMMRVRGFWYEWVRDHDDWTSEDCAETGAGSKGTRRLKPLVSQGCILQLYESKLPPLLRYFHINNISPSGWVFLPMNRMNVPTDTTTTCMYEYICGVKDVVPQPQKETRVPYKICSFDIEASSSHGDFPIPIKTYKRLVMQMIDVFRTQTSHVDMGKEQEQGLIKRLVLAAFGYGKFSDIDLVYPKGTAPSKKQLETVLIPQLLAYSFSNVMSGDASSQGGALSIEAMFERMKEHSALGVGGRDEDDGEGGGDEDPEEIVLDIEDDLEDDLDDHSSNSKKSSSATVSGKNTKPAVKSKKIPTKITCIPTQAPDITILDILKTDKHSRDEKIQWINHVLSNPDILGFPPLEGDKVTFIGSTFMRYGEPEPYMNHCIVLNTCDPVPNTIIETTTNEYDLLMKWTQLIQTENPDIIIGYNIFGFDYEFMFRRSQEMGCDATFLQLSRKLEAPDQVTEGFSKKAPDLDNTKIVLATGEYDLRYPKMPGRLQIDMYTYFRRDFNLASYKLDDVAGQFIRDDVKKVEFVTDNDGTMTTDLYTNNITGLHVGDYIHIEISGFTSDYYRDGHKFVVTEIRPAEKDGSAKNIISVAGHETDLIVQSKSIKWCMTKDDVSPQDIFRLSEGSSADRARVAKYCIQDCNLVHHLMNKIDVITGYVEMSRICSVPISFLVFRGQGIKLTSYVSKKCREKNTLMPDLEKSFESDGYEGAIVLPPKCSMYMDNPVACLDYASLYPSSMISNNLSPDSKVWTKEYDLKGKLLHQTGDLKYDNLEHLGYKYIDIEFDTFQWRRNPEKPKAKAEKTKTGKKVCRWVQLPNHQKSILPAILEELLQARSNTRKLIKTEKDPFMQNILDKRQLGYKVTANSLYGQCGARTSTFYEKDVAASTTATGRMMIIYAKRIIEEVYGDLEYTTEEHGDVKCCAEYVYGDSVAEYTPVYVRVDGRYLDICTISDLANKYGGGAWTACREEGKQDKEFCELHNIESWTEKGWTKLLRVIRHPLASHKKLIRIVTGTGLVDVTDDHSLLSATTGLEISPKECAIGTALLHHTIDDDVSYRPPGRLSIHKLIMDEIINEYEMYVIRETNQLWAAVYLHILKNECKFRVSFDYDETTKEYVIIVNPGSSRSSNSISPKIRHMKEIPYEGYVYDLTTENHHFAAGVGNMIVHNTDSVFFTFNLKDPKNGQDIRGKKALEITIKIAQDAAKLCTQYLKSPMELSYEKTMMPFILLSKKRYVGMLYEEDPNKGKMKYMGLSLKRRDSCDYLKDVYGGILNILMKENNVQQAVEYLESSLQELIQGTVPMDKLAITKALRGHYKNPQQIAHAVLAERIGKRDPGNKPKPGDRMKFVHIVNKDGGAKALQGDKIETPEFIVQNRVPIDYSFYITNQLMKPLQQLFGLALEPICQFKGRHSMIKTIKKDVQEIEKEFGDSIELFMKKREKYCSTQVKTLIFETYLTDIQNKKLGFQSIMGCFGKGAACSLQPHGKGAACSLQPNAKGAACSLQPNGKGGSLSTQKNDVHDPTIVKKKIRRPGKSDQSS